MNCSHPYGVQPTHIQELIGDSNTTRDKGLGRLHILSDEAIINILGYLPASSLAVLAAVSRGFYVFANHEELWKALVLEVSRELRAFGQLWTLKWHLSP